MCNCEHSFVVTSPSYRFNSRIIVLVNLNIQYIMLRAQFSSLVIILWLPAPLPCRAGDKYEYTPP
jgi:hypothetical protein